MRGHDFVSVFASDLLLPRRKCAAVRPLILVSEKAEPLLPPVGRFNIRAARLRCLTFCAMRQYAAFQSKCVYPRYGLLSRLSHREVLWGTVVGRGADTEDAASTEKTTPFQTPYDCQRYAAWREGYAERESALDCRSIARARDGAYVRPGADVSGRKAYRSEVAAHDSAYKQIGWPIDAC